VEKDFYLKGHLCNFLQIATASTTHSDYYTNAVLINITLTTW